MFLTTLFSFIHKISSKRPSLAIHSTTFSRPIGINQNNYYSKLSNSSISIVLATGPAGCGKTMLACNSMIEALGRKEVDKLIITRPHVSVDGEEIGFLPGSISQKMEPWTHPVFDLFSSYLSKTRLQTMLKEGIIEVVPLGFMRGRTFDRSWVLADEMQNSSPIQMKMLLTRLGKGSKMTITGDLDQSDRTIEENGLSHFIDLLEEYPYDDISHIVLDSSDVQRSLVVSRILSLYE
jgi:phosphate starvation-inducible PhoH-like protein